MTMTFAKLCKEAETATDERVKAESPSIRDTPGRRYSVFQGTLTCLLVRDGIDVDVEKVRKAGEKYAFGPRESVPEPAPAPISQLETPLSDEK